MATSPASPVEMALGVGGVTDEEREFRSAEASEGEVIPRALAGAVGLQIGVRLRTGAVAKKAIGLKRARDRGISCRLPKPVESMPLYSLDGAEQLERLIQQMKAHWAAAITA